MKSLETVQKTFKVFQILVKVARTLCIVGALICAGFLIFAIIYNSGGQAFGLFGENLLLFPEGTDVKQAIGELIVSMITLTADAVLLVFAGGYLKAEQADGTPFTESGAERLKKLGIRCIYIPIAAIIISVIPAVIFDASVLDELDNLPSVILGVVLILISLIFRYGAELEAKNHTNR